MKHKKSEQGVTLYLAILALAAMLGIVFGMGSLFLNQIQLTRGVGSGVLAFYAAEAGIEREALEGNGIGSSCGGTLSNGALYTVAVIDPGDPDCNGNVRCIKSQGAFQDAQRAIWLDF